jgi:ribosome biogenesis GTPase A
MESSGIIPGRFDDQLAASRLAMCNDIGEAAYVDSLIAAKMVEMMRLLPGIETQTTHRPFIAGET